MQRKGEKQIKKFFLNSQFCILNWKLIVEEKLNFVFKFEKL